MDYNKSKEVVSMLNFEDECFYQHNEISFSQYKYNKDRKSIEHTHDFFEIAYVADGCGKHIVNGKSFDISKGDYIIIDSSASHYYTGEIEIRNLLFRPRFLDKTYKNIRTIQEMYQTLMFNNTNRIAPVDPIYCVFKDTNDILDKIMYIKEEIENKQIGYIECSKAVLLQIIMISIRNIFSENNSNSNSPIAYIEKYIYEHYDEDINLSSLCNELGYSLSHISKKFKFETGYTFSEYLQKTRIHFACRFFVNSPGAKVYDVAEKVGYNDIKYFSKIFKKYIGTSPRTFSTDITKAK